MKKSPFKKLLKWIGIILGILVFALYIGLPVGMGVFALTPAQKTVSAAPEGFTEVSLQTSDGETLAAWYLPPSNGAVILLLHGAGGSRDDVRAYAQMLARNGYGVLAMDLRGHGESSGKTNRLGWPGTPDVSAAVAYLQAQEEVQQIGALGLSMGGEVLLGAAAENPAISAIVADGATRRSLEELQALPAERSLVHSFTPGVMFTTVRIFGGQKPPAPLLDSMIAATETRFFFIAAGSKTLEVEFNQLFAETLGPRATLWVAPQATHIGAFALYPAEYEQRVMDFFNSTLIGE